MIKRIAIHTILQRLNDHKVHIILGPRQSGKTTLAKEIERECNIKSRWFNGDEADVQVLFATPTSTRIRALIGDAGLVIIDEAQRIENIGIVLKLLVDNYPELKIIVTGSSSLDLANKINEPLTGRKWEYLLLPLAFGELTEDTGIIEERRMLNHRLTYGYYPEIVTSPGREAELLKQLVNSYLYKDIFIWERILKPERLVKLLTVLALQIACEVSYNELSISTGLDIKTIEKYLDLLEKTFVIFRLHAFSRNIRNELKKSRKVYFYDCGVRNALINNFLDPSLRADTGKLWENYLIIERLKWMNYNNHFVNRYFWRTTQQQEIDYIEEKDGILNAYEFKWNPGKGKRFPKTFLNAYPGGTTTVISPENYDTFLLGHI